MNHVESSVEDTNAEALVAKISAIDLGYFSDPFAHKFCKSTSKKECIINRGYWARVEIIKTVVERFLNLYKDQNTQIISLGAGYDTLYFNLKIAQKHNFDHIKYIEMDLPNVVKKKVKLMLDQKDLIHLINEKGQYEVAENNAQLKSQSYSIVPIDLRDAKDLNKHLVDVGIDFKLPTLIFAECVLIYLPTQNANGVMSFFAENFDTVYLMNWEMMKLKDPFGQMMIHNFEARGYDLLGIHEYPDVPSLQARFKELGYTNVEVYDMLTVYNSHLDQNERKRIEKIEWLDELEEWNVIQKHYYFALCSKIKGQTNETAFVKVAQNTHGAHETHGTHEIHTSHATILQAPHSGTHDTHGAQGN